MRISAGKRPKKLKRLKKKKFQFDAGHYHNAHQVQSAIDKLRKDNEGIKERIQLLQTAVPVTAKLGKEITRMRDVREEMLRKVKRIQRMTEVKSEEYKLLQKEMEIERNGSGGVNYLRNERHKVQYQLRVLENRLEMIMARYNNSIAENRSLKQQIYTIRQECKVFDRIYKGMEKELTERKNTISNVIEKSNIAYEESDAIKKEIDKVKVYKGLLLHDLAHQFKTLDNIIEHNENLQEIIRKGELEDTQNMMKTTFIDDSVVSDDSFTNNNREEGEYDEDYDDDDEEEEDGENVRQRGHEYRSRMPNEEEDEKIEDDYAPCEMTKEELVEVFDALEKELGLSPEELAKELEEMDHQNFSLYLHSNELQNELQTLELNIKEMRKEVNSYESGEKAKAERERERKFKYLQKQITETKGNEQLFEEKEKASRDVLDSLLEPLKSLFNEIECDQKRIIEQRGNFEVTPSNILFILSLVENKMDQLISIVKKKQRKVQLKVGPKEQSKKRTKINPPSSLYIFDQDEEVPLTREEMKKRFENTNNRRRNF